MRRKPSGLPAGIRRIFRLPPTRERLMRDVDEEARLHIQQWTEEFRARGLSMADAEAAAHHRFGDVSGYRVCEERRARRRARWQRVTDFLVDFRSDLRFARRHLAKAPAFTLIAVFTLALGIGANTAIFSVVHAVLLESLPFREPARLARLYETVTFDGGTRELGSVSVPNYLDWRAQNRVFEDLAAYEPTTMDLAGSGSDPPERVRVVRGTPNLFSVLGTHPEAGRTFLPDEDRPGHGTTALLSDGFWRRRFGADPAIVGTAISLDNSAVTVIGVMPAGFDYPVEPTHTDVWITGPWVVWTEHQATQRDSRFLRVIGRLRAGQDSVSAMAEMTSIAGRIAREHPTGTRPRGFQLRSLRSAVVGDVRTPLFMLLGAVALVLLIACANVANLLLARASGRRREIALRTALGAQRGRLVRQLLTESVLLSLLGGALGLAVARWGLSLVRAYASSTLPRSDAIGLDAAVLGFALALSVVAAAAFGAVPALRASHADLREDLTDSTGRTGMRHGQHRMLGGLVIAEIALSLMLLVGAGLLVRGFVEVIRTDPGLKPGHVLTFHIAAPAVQLPDSARYTAFYGPLLARLRALPGARRVATATLLPIQESDWNGTFTIVGRPRERDPSRAPFAEYRVVSSDYFRVLGIPMVTGREFTEQDALDAPPVMIVNDEFVKRYFPNENPIGRQILPWTDAPATIVGVARSVRQVGLDQPPRAELYVAAAQTPWQLSDVAYAILTEAPPEAMAASVRATVRDFAPSQPIARMETMDAVISKSLAGRKLLLTLLGCFAGLALVLSAAGVYGVMSYAVTRRTREIGIRMAMGAGGAEVTSMILRDAGRLTALGITIGLAAAWAFSRVLTSMVYTVSTHDPLTFLLVPGLIGLVALTASYVPARRASRVDPLNAIRAE